MIQKRFEADLKNFIENILIEKYQETDYIGEVCVGWDCYGYSRVDRFDIINKRHVWWKFKEADIEEKLDDIIKIFGCWVKKSHVLYYYDQYGKDKKEIENRIIVS